MRRLRFVLGEIVGTTLAWLEVTVKVSASLTSPSLPSRGIWSGAPLRTVTLGNAASAGTAKRVRGSSASSLGLLRAGRELGRGFGRRMLTIRRRDGRVLRIGDLSS